MYRNVLPGQQQPYFLESGEGQRFLLGPFLATIIGHRLDTGSLMEGVVLIGAEDSAVPLHRHSSSHEAIYVLEGAARLRLGHKELTDGPKGHRIPNHVHEKHTETFFCLNGSVSMTAAEEEVSLRPGDFLHVPAGTPHTFQLTGNNTRFIQFHAPGINEPFFRFMCDPCEECTFLQPPPPFRFDRVIQHLAELDVKFLE